MKPPEDQDAGAPPAPVGEQPVRIPIEDTLDLHSFDPREVKDLLDDYLEEARARGFMEVRIVHGKGKGMLARSVHSILGKHPLVVSYRLCGPGGGGWGATMVVLKPAPPSRNISVSER